MGLFDAFRKSPKEKRTEEAHKRAMKEDMEVYSGMRVEATSEDGRVFFVARLLDLRGDRAQLEPGADGSLMTRSDEPVKVTLRGYSSKEGRAVSMEGSVRVGAGKLWQVENLALQDSQAEHRVNVRVEIDIPGSFTVEGRPGVPEESCQIRNMGMGGACLSSQARRDVGDKLCLRIERLLELDNTPLSCQIVRIEERKSGSFVYGCRFADVDEEMERRLFRAMYALYHGLYS